MVGGTTEQNSTKASVELSTKAQSAPLDTLRAADADHQRSTPAVYARAERGVGVRSHQQVALVRVQLLQSGHVYNLGNEAPHRQILAGFVPGSERGAAQFCDAASVVNVSVDVVYPAVFAHLCDILLSAIPACMIPGTNFKASTNLYASGNVLRGCS